MMKAMAFRPTTAAALCLCLAAPIEVSFSPRLAADLTLESLWGEMWSELELTPLPAPPPHRRRQDGRLVIEAGHAAALRAGAGGPQIHIETLNGDIFIRKESQR